MYYQATNVLQFITSGFMSYSCLDGSATLSLINPYVHLQQDLLCEPMQHCTIAGIIYYFFCILHFTSQSLLEISDVRMKPTLHTETFITLDAELVFMVIAPRQHFFLFSCMFI